ncbi:heavy-metal-associated domain-containing protein [Acidobacterium sp. S8]|uniref:heavy-metal-associated domain-containing protein n=1 Tax=Acidobacterium sp. S8 TaxID=1641854 RepID=UPI00131B6AB8|nr:heavy-metal-associated domain-containing protein [Acidobacterium sp. S8]
MLRRRFIQIAALAGIGGVATVERMEAGEIKTVTYKVKGFTCITCAVGLETLLKQQKGVTWVKASYPEASAIIKYNPAQVTENALKSYIAETGFSVESENKG